MIRTKEGQKKHDDGVALFAISLIKNGWSLVRSDLPGNIKPPQIGDHIPDIYARHGIEEVIIEVETNDTENSSHSLEQYAVFRAWAKQSSSRQFLLKVV